MDGTDTFETHRRHLLGLAYRMTGSLAESEDVVQEAWLRWQRVTPEAIEAPRAWLTRTTTRLCLDVLKSARARREQYVGPWLPEPVVGARLDGIDAATELADDVSLALLLALERLSPLERAAFLLHDVFDVDHREVAATLDRSEAACRQLAARARAHVRAARPRHRAAPEEHARVLAAFAAAVQSGDTEALEAVLAHDVVFTSDGGGRVTAALKPVTGADRVARFLFGISARYAHGDPPRAHPALLNGALGFVLQEGGRPVSAMAFDVVDGRIVAIYAVRNPDKLARIPPFAG